MSIIWIVVFLVAVPLVAPLVVGAYLEQPWVMFQSSVDWTILFLGGLSWLTAYAVWRVHSWGYYLFFAYAVIVAAFDAFSLYRSNSGSYLWYGIDATFVTVGITLLLRSRTRKVFFESNMRWWERAKRYKVNEKCQIISKDTVLDRDIVDISKSGLFLRTIEDAKIGDELKIRLRMSDEVIEVDGLVMRQSENPAGTGIRFKDLKFNQRRIVQKWLEQSVRSHT